MKPKIIPTNKQHFAWEYLKDSTTRYILFGGGAGGGKTWLGCEWLTTNCYIHEGSRWFIGREELTRLKASTYITLLKVFKHHKIPRADWTYNGQDHYIQFVNGSRIDLLDLRYLPRDPLYERYGSVEYDGGWIEEGGEINFGAFDTLKSRIGRNLQELKPGKILITCNPKKNWLYSEFYKPFKEKTLPDNKAFIQSLVDDNTYIGKEYKQNLINIKDKSKKERLLFGNWEYDDDPATLIDYNAIIDAFSNDFIPGGQKYITCDVARLGSDLTVIMVWNGWIVEDIIYYNTRRTNYTQDKIFELHIDHKIPLSRIIVDEDGVGGGVVDNLRCKGFVNNSKPFNEENYSNLKSQCSFELAKKVNAREILIKTEDEFVRTQIIEELEVLKNRDVDGDGKLQVLKKDEVKQLIGRSPNFKDALIMRKYFDYSKKGIIAYG